ncbi:MAG: metallophosphoesterase [Melioribacter sp.]|uniref:metallophosphoesterase n=1 Tax=Rosettibacter primus TaxID=3111523 RepID=UPI00247DFFFB|nr:metallophosphoesterase [Melioribacter sp.]
MKTTQAITFFAIVFTIYGLINFYIARRIISVIPDNYKNLSIIVLVFLILSYIFGRILENYWVSYLSDFLIWCGSFWIAVMFYSFLFIITIDLIRIINHFLHFLPSFITENPVKVKKFLAACISILVLILIMGGYFTSKIINVRKYELFINKKAGNLKSLNIVMASDLHLGTINGKMFAYKIVDKINKLKPDIILLAGDIIDEDIKPVLKDNVGEALFELKAKYGIFGITGNHEYIGGVEDAVNYLNAHKIQMLRDSSILIDNTFYIVGREDRSINRFSEKNRKELSELTKDLDKSLPIILMDHQPFHLEEAEQNGIDLQLSGHTHNGQLWPLNYIIRKIYELPWGYKRKGNTHYYVSCGAGGWGPPIRIGSLPEIVNIKLHFNE